MRRAFFGVLAIAFAFVAITLAALESGGVAIVRTRDASGALRSTHVWYVEADGELWIEAGTPENGWYRDVQQNPVLEIEVDGVRRRRRAEPLDDGTAHAKLRTRLREKYGIRDRWVGLLVDTSRSIAVRLAPVADGEPAHP